MPDEADPRSLRLAALARAIGEALGPLVPAGSPCALLDFPAYPNVGDSATWLGARAYLAGVGARVVYAADNRSYSREGLARRLSDGPILITGGGNFGDLYPERQRFREQIIRDFPTRRIIQLPQSIHFRDRDHLRRAQAIFNRHPDFVLAVRDRQSLALARRNFAGRVVLCPDMAFALGALRRSRARTAAILCLLRTDAESRLRTFPLGPGTIRVDWMKGERLALKGPAGARPSLRSYDRLAARRLRRGIRMVRRGAVVITDRLHGHIICTLLGVPHVFLDNTYGKNRSFYRTWTSSDPLCAWADSVRQALIIAGRWAEQHRHAFDYSRTGVA